MLCRVIIAACSQTRTNHINTLCGQNVGFVNVQPGGTYSNHWALRFCSPFRVAFIYYKVLHIGTIFGHLLMSICAAVGTSIVQFMQYRNALPYAQ